MPRMTKAKARKRLREAAAKFQKVYTASNLQGPYDSIVHTADMVAVEKIVAKCLKRIR